MSENNVQKKRSKLDRAFDWIDDHKEALLVIVPVSLAAIKLGGKAINTYKVQRLQNCTCYDRSLGHYWQLKRPLKNEEWVAIEQRRKNGERLADILSELRVLK